MIQVPGNLRRLSDGRLAALEEELAEAWRHAVAAARRWPGDGGADAIADQLARVRTEMDRRVTP